jgi:hypothetical protein
MSFLNVANNASSILAAGISAGDTSLTVAAGEGARFPASNFHITIEDEILLCTTRTGDVLTVTRAQEGTAAAAHAAAKAVRLNITAAIIQELQNKPAFRAYNNVVQSIPTGTPFTKVQYPLISFDTHGGYDEANHRYVAPEDGYYVIVGSCGLVNLGDGKRLALMLYKNGVEIARLFDVVVGGVAACAGAGSAILQLSKNDYIEIFIYHDNGTALGTLNPYEYCQVFSACKLT